MPAVERSFLFLCKFKVKQYSKVFKMTVLVFDFHSPLIYGTFTELGEMHCQED